MYTRCKGNEVLKGDLKFHHYKVKDNKSLELDGKDKEFYKGHIWVRELLFNIFFTIQ